MPQDIPIFACTEAAKLFESISAKSHDPELMRICAKGLHDMTAYPAEYNNLRAAGVFRDELCTALSRKCLAKTECKTDPHALAFRFLEALAVIIREATLRQGAKQLRPAQAAVLRYFEKSGYWSKGDGTLVTEYYYDRVTAQFAL